MTLSLSDDDLVVILVALGRYYKQAPAGSQPREQARMVLNGLRRQSGLPSVEPTTP